MEHFLINNYSNCLNTLLEYDTCGVFLTRRSNWFYAGNFWWAKNKYVASLSPCDPSNRFYSESRFLHLKVGRHKIFLSGPDNLYSIGSIGSIGLNPKDTL